MGKIRLLIYISILLIGLTGCGKQAEEPKKEPVEASQEQRVDTGFVVTTPDSYDSADTAILVRSNHEENTATFLNLELGKRYTLAMDGTTRFYDKYGESISFSQVQLGDIVEVKFLKTKKHLTSLKLHAQAWRFDNIEKFEIDEIRDEISIGSDIYKITANTQFLSENQEIMLQDINPSDVLSVQGIDSQVLTIRVEKGHGYLRLVNDENFIGGWIEIGQSVVRKITEDMLLLVPEGSYQVNISNQGGGGQKNVTINRNQETVLDIGDLEIPEPQYGMILFSLDPPDAEVYIDGSLVDVSAPVNLVYGLHQLIARAKGYQSVTQYFKVARESAGINVVLDSTDKESGKESESSSAETVTDYYKVYIDAPEKAEVYLDGNYVGIVPCSFRKVPGVHVVILRQNGYETRSYTVQFEEDNKDLSYSFADLLPIQQNSTEESSVESSKENVQN